MIEEALYYASLGWRIVPLHSVKYDRQGNPVCSCGKLCKSPAKHPLTPKGLNNSTINKDWIVAWWKKWPWANIGIVTGEQSNLIVLDVDKEPGGYDSLGELESKREPIPDTVMSLTGSGGMHILFKHPGVKIRNRAGLLGPGLDIRGDGGYIVAPPSVHITGNRYEWEGSSEPTDVPVADMPKWLVALLEDKKHICIREYLKGDVIEGGRNNYLASCAGAMRKRGMVFESIKSALVIENSIRCNPPLEETEVIAIAESISRYQPG